MNKLRGLLQEKPEYVSRINVLQQRHFSIQLTLLASVVIFLNVMIFVHVCILTRYSFLSSVCCLKMTISTQRHVIVGSRQQPPFAFCVDWGKKKIWHPQHKSTANSGSAILFQLHEDQLKYLSFLPPSRLV